ncbi:MAG: DUF4097 domain-containing protein [Candidatus Aminicenantaceae bacterium]
MKKIIPHLSYLLLILFLIHCKTFSPTPLRKEFHKEMDLVKNSCIYIENVNGDLEITGWKKDKIEITAIKMGTGSQLRQTDIDINKKDNNLRIKALFPRADISEVYVDFELRVPEEIQIKEIKIEKGDLSTHQIYGELRAEIQEGNINLEDFSGICEVTTDEGDISAKIPESKNSDNFSFKTTKGDILIHLPPELSAQIAAETRLGVITSDFFPSDKKETPLKSLKETFGKGKAAILIKTWNGNIRIKKIQ